MPAIKPFLAAVAMALAVIGLAATGASAEPASASVAGSQPAPANFGKLPASWHGYAPPVKRATVCSNAEAIFNRNSGKVAEVYDSATNSGAIVDQWTYNGTQTQHWCFILDYDWQGQIPVYEIINNNSGLCLDLPADHVVDGQHLQQWACNGSAAQQWLWTNMNTFDVIAPSIAYDEPSNDYSMEVYGSNTSNGGEVDIWTDNATATQGWCPGSPCA